jgi:Domain of unknown function (DU1801)
MAKYELKTKATPVGVEEFIGTVADEQQRVDAYQITALMERLSGHPPKMWGPSIIGFGQYHYKYASGHEGDMARISFSPRKSRTVLYIAAGFTGHAELMAKLGKHKTGKSCLYIKRLGDVDETVLEQLCKASLKYMAQEYPE